jgi:hypothetical protein
MIARNPGAGAVVFRQEIGGTGFRPAHPSEVRPGGVDGGQYVLRGDLVGDERFRDEGQCDGRFLQRLHAKAPGRFVFVNDRGLLTYNALRPGEGLGRL